MSCFVPDDLVALILCQLSLVDFLSAATTCRAWRTAARKRAAWPTAVCVAFNLLSAHSLRSRPLVNTVWASCGCLYIVDDPWGYESLLSLPHVSDLSLICKTIHESTILSSGRSMLARLTSLRTNSVALVHATSYDCLTRLTIANPCQHMDGWLQVLPKLTSLTHVKFDTTIMAHDVKFNMLGRTLAQLIHSHHTLHTIQLPPISSCICDGLLSDPALDLSSLRTLSNAPLDTRIMCRIIRRLPCLSTYNNEWIGKGH
jgi:hypothetical protein